MSKQYYVHICLLCLYVASPTLAFHFNVSSDDAPENISSSAPEKVEEDILSSAAEKVELVDCSSLRLGQYICPDPSIDQIDPDTQQFRGCVQGKEIASEGEAEVQCIAASGIICEGTRNSTFKRKMPCKWTNGYSFEIALLLSVFLGMFGLDRFYLGYPGIGLVKLCTLGFMFLGQLLDIILIAAQVVGPSDGSAYVIPYYGAGVTVIRSNNETYLLPQTDWHNIT